MVSPIFLPRVPLMNPRTLCACQPVAFMILLRVAPPGRFRRSRTLAVLLPSRAPLAFGVAALAAFLAGATFLGLAAAALGFPPLALFWLLGAPFLVLAPFFEVPFPGATCAPCAATAAEGAVLAAVSVVIFVLFSFSVGAGSRNGGRGVGACCVFGGHFRLISFCGRCRVTTSITPIRMKVKAILKAPPATTSDKTGAGRTEISLLSTGSSRNM